MSSGLKIALGLGPVQVVAVASARRERDWPGEARDALESIAVRLDPSRLPEPLRSALEQEVRPLHSLEQVVRWVFSRTPPSEVADVVVQDEFTHDVVFPWRGVHLVFDTT